MPLVTRNNSKQEKEKEIRETKRWRIDKMITLGGIGIAVILALILK